MEGGVGGEMTGMVIAANGDARGLEQKVLVGWL